MKRFSSYLSAALAVLLLALSVTSSTVHADGSSSLSITPRKNYIIKPGQTITDKLTIGNLDKQSDLTLTLRMIDFTFTDLSGTPKLSLAQNAPQMPWSLKPFTTLPKTVTVPVGETKTINYTISIPKNQGAGSYYSAILYQSGAPNGGQVALNASGVTLAFVSVPGTVQEKMALQKFGAYNSDDDGNTGSFVFIDTNNAPKTIAYTVKNEGNVFENPAGNIVLKDMFGHQVANMITNSNGSLALLGQTRIYPTCIKTVQQSVKLLGGETKDKSCVDPQLKPGKYTASLDVFYGQNGNQTKEITAIATFWYLPWWFIVTVIVLLLAIASGIWWLYRKIRTAVKGSTYKSGRGLSRRAPKK